MSDWDCHLVYNAIHASADDALQVGFASVPCSPVLLATFPSFFFCDAFVTKFRMASTPNDAATTPIHSPADSAGASEPPPVPRVTCESRLSTGTDYA
jgi:hypothetical protein